MPKNPSITDHIIAAAIERKYGKKELIELDDSQEYEAKEYAEKICFTNNAAEHSSPEMGIFLFSFVFKEQSL
ncbi:hypothetical protein [Paenibacillus andongensis]|uniref:hypothetical protein n=1 Tax=Paenibacillus andongensis TaxID=2975482 RepID=UPI003F5922C3